MKRLSLLLALGLIAAACGGDGGSDGAGSLVVYSGRSEELVAPLIERFEAETGIDVDVRYAASGDLATTLIQEGDASPADVFYAQDPAFSGAVALEGLLTGLPDDVLARVPARFSDSEGRWVGVTARSRVMVYNPDLVAADELPASVWDLVDPAWQGRLGVAPTNGSFVAFVSAMVLTDGEDRTLEWLEGIAANDPVIFDGNSPIVAATDAGDVDAGLVNHYYLLRLADEQGGSTARNHYFAGDDPGALVMPTGAGILSSAANPEQAERFVRFLLSEESQSYFLDSVFEYPLIEGAGTPDGQVPLGELGGPDIPLSDLATVLDTATRLIAEAGLT